MPRRTALPLAALLALGLSVSTASAQTAPFALPADPNAWLNSPPLTSEMLAGKAAFLWFFEEDCPRCRAKWPEMYDAAKKFDGKPVVFIAINSGNGRPTVQQYAREVALRWPTIVDTDRSLESAGEVGTISLQNIYQAKLLMPDGAIQRADWSDIEGSVNGALRTAKWRVEPGEVPEALKPAWLQIEFGQFAAAAPLVKKQLNAPNPATKSAAEKLRAAVVAELEKETAAAKAARDTNEKWRAYKAYSALGVKFKGWEIPADAAGAVGELATDEAVKTELTAKRQWDSVERQLASGGLTKAAGSQLERLVKQFPGTEAAKNAQAVLDRATATP